MKTFLTTIRYTLFSSILLILVTHTVITFVTYHNMTIIGYICSYPSAILFYIGIALFMIKKNLTDFLSFVIFASVFVFTKIMMFLDVINYCKEENLKSIGACSNAVIPIIFGRDWIEDSLNILLVIIMTFLLINLLKKRKVKFK